MKNCLLIALCLVPFMGAHATGGFDCQTEDKTIEIFGTTAASVGNPLISVTVVKDGKEIDYSKAQAVAYWNLDQTALKLALADKDYLQIDYELNVAKTVYDNRAFSYGSLKVAGEQSTYKVFCQF